MSSLDRWNGDHGGLGDVLVRPTRAWQRRMLTRCLILSAALLAWLPTAPGRADMLPETTLRCGTSHFYENETNRVAVLTVQVFNAVLGSRRAD